jgi:phosphoribosylcarboxyaminoimidazole (NCAIR) mutase
VNPETQRELEALLEARKELGREHEQHLVERFLERIDGEIDRRVDERLAHRVPKRQVSPLNPATIAVCIPIVAIAGGIGKLPGLIVAFAALAVVFAVAIAQQRR